MAQQIAKRGAPVSHDSGRIHLPIVQARNGLAGARAEMRDARENISVLLGEMKQSRNNPLYFRYWDMLDEAISDAETCLALPPGDWRSPFGGLRFLSDGLGRISASRVPRPSIIFGRFVGEDASPGLGEVHEVHVRPGALGAGRDVLDVVAVLTLHKLRPGSHCRFPNDSGAGSALPGKVDGSSLTPTSSRLAGGDFAGIGSWNMGGWNNSR